MMGHRLGQLVGAKFCLETRPFKNSCITTWPFAKQFKQELPGLLTELPNNFKIQRCARCAPMKSHTNDINIMSCPQLEQCEHEDIVNSNFLKERMHEDNTVFMNRATLCENQSQTPTGFDPLDKLPIIRSCF